MDCQDKGGSTALHWAMDGGDVELIEYLVQKGSEIDKTDYNGWSPLLRLGKYQYFCKYFCQHDNCGTW